MKCIEDEIPFNIPDTWAWCRIRDICNMSAGKSKSADKISDAPFENSYPCFGGNGIRGYVDEYSNDGTYSIVGRQGALCGNVNIASGKFYATEHAVVTYLYSMIDFKWSNFCLEGLNLNRFATGAAQPGLSVANVLNVLLPLPPFNEQRNIGQMVDKALIISNNLGTEKDILLEIIAKTKSKILDLAIRGKLVSQNETDEPASDLLKRIRSEKDALIKHGKLKRDKKESIIYKGDDNSYYEKFSDGSCKCIDENLPFDIPKNWEWCNLSMIGTTNIGLTYKPENISNNGTIVLRSSNIVNGKIDYSDIVKVNSQIRESQFAEENDILICARNGSRALVGKCAIIPKTDEKMSFGAFMAIYRTAFYRYVYLFLNSKEFKKVFDDSNSTAINQLTQDMLKRTILPFPPLAEQIRIYNMVGKLFSEIESIENSLT